MNIIKYLMPAGRFQKEIDKAGPGDVHLPDQSVAVAKAGKDDFGNLARCFLFVTGQEHGNVACKVTMVGISGNFNDKGGDQAGVQGLIFVAVDEGLMEQAVQGFFHCKRGLSQWERRLFYFCGSSALFSFY